MSPATRLVSARTGPDPIPLLQPPPPDPSVALHPSGLWLIPPKKDGQAGSQHCLPPSTGQVWPDVTYPTPPPRLPWPLEDAL